MRALLGSAVLVLNSWLAFDLVAAQTCPQLVWSDEFDGAALDTSKWEPMIGDGCDIGLCGWGNNELQWYKAENAAVANGALTITAKKERVRSRLYTSARLRTRNLGDWTYGRFEARIKLPAGQGLWPAFWMLPTDEVYGGWPQSGEIDILEVKGQSTSVIYGTIHFGDPWPNNRNSGSELWNRTALFSDDYHVYAIEWEPNEIRWYLDDRLYGRKTPTDLRGHPWPFDQRFHLLINMAVGGNFVGAPDDSIFPKAMEIDYVRVYDRAAPTLNGPDRVAQNAAGAVFTVEGEPSGGSYSWTVPAGAAIVSGQGTDSVTVNFGTESGDVAVNLSNACSSAALRIPVYVEPPETAEAVHEDFEGNRLTLLFASGSLNDSAPNPDPTGVNSSPIVGHYVRDSASQYDTIVYAFPLADAGPFTTGAKRFYMDVYSTAPAATPITVQLEDSSTATSSNFPTGRHSSYLARTSVQNQWERLAFDFNARWDGNTPDNAIDRLIILYDGGWFSGDAYDYDNLSTYSAGSTGCTASAMHVASLALSTVNAGGGNKRGRAEVAMTDNCGAAVASANVTGTFTGDFNETHAASTSANGVATLTTDGMKKGSVQFTFCVDSASHASLTYDPAANAVTCGNL